MTKSRGKRDFVIFTSCTYKPNSVRALAKAEAQYSHLSSLIDHSMGQAALTDFAHRRWFKIEYPELVVLQTLSGTTLS